MTESGHDAEHERDSRVEIAGGARGNPSRRSGNFAAAVLAETGARHDDLRAASWAKARALKLEIRHGR